MRVDVVTLFPELVNAVAESGVTGRAIDRGLATLQTWNPRDFTEDRHRTVDDRPYGGGPGMVMMVEPLRRSIQAIRAQSQSPIKVGYLSPQGRRFDQAAVDEILLRGHLVLVAGRYEGVDERLLQSDIDEEWSIGDYVLSGGELAGMVMIDAVVRCIPGALGDEDSALLESFQNGLLEGPQYTRPEEIDGQRVPDVLLGGDHAKIGRWRQQQALGRTWQRRPDLLSGRMLTTDEQELLNEFMNKGREENG